MIDTNFSVNDIAEITKTNRETVLRWIKSKKLKANLNSKKEGYVISDIDLKAFLDSNPKYKSIASETLKALGSGLVAGGVMTAGLAKAATTTLGLAGFTASVPVVGVPLATVIGIASGIGMRLLKRKKDVTKDNFEDEIKAEIVENENKISKLESELSNLKTRNESLKQALGLDLENIVCNLNDNI